MPLLNFQKRSAHKVESGESNIVSVVPVEISYKSFTVGCKSLDYYEAEKIAQDDGFIDLPDMLHWFDETHGLPFYGDLIKWE